MFLAKDIASIVNGEVIGNPNASISGFSNIEISTPGTLTFYASSKFVDFFISSKASVILVSRNLLPASSHSSTLIAVDNAKSAIIQLMKLYNQQNNSNATFVSDKAFIHDNCTIGNNCTIDAFAYISENSIINCDSVIYPHVFVGKNVVIGNNTILYSGVKIYDNCLIGNNCIIHAGTVIGADGFGFVQEDKKNIKIPHLGNVIIKDDVEIGSNCTIDKATLGSTIIHQGVKMDNLIHIAHNTEIGDFTVIASQTGIAGSTKIGKNCMIGGQVGIIDHIIVGDNVKIVAQSGVMSNIKDNETVMGAPSFNFSEYKRAYACFRKLPEKLNKLENDSKNNY